MARFDYDIGVIGGGAAGLTTAAGSAQLGASTLLVEREPQLGGDCLHYGCVPSKTLIHTAHLYHQLTRYDKYGLPPVTREPVDFSRVALRIREVIGGIQHHDSVERFSGLGVDVRFGEARFVDEHTIELDGRRINAAKWLIATGSSPSFPEIPGLDKVSVLTNREIFSLEVLPEKLVVLGGGPIGVEMAQAFSRLGSEVVVVQRGDQILSREDRDMADAVMFAMKEEGVRFRLGCTLLSVSEDKEIKLVRIRTREGAEEEITGSHLLVALGRSVNGGELGLDNCGIEYSPAGIAVDARLRTSTKHIFCAGDATGTYQFTHAAGYEGGVVLTNAILRLPRKADYRWMPWCTYTGPELASIGMNEKRAQRAGIDYSVHEELFEDNDRAQAEGKTTGRIKLLLDKRGKPLGVQILGPHGGELLSEWVAALNSKMRLSTMAGAIHPYPTLAEINKRVVGSVLSEKLFSDKVRKILRLLFGYKSRTEE